MKLGFVALLLLGLVGVSSETQALQVPTLSSPVMDEAGVIGSRASQALEQLIRKANERGKIQLTVLTLQSLEGEPIEQASIQITDQWKLGTKSKDNGVLFLVVPSERKARIEVGQGLEGDIPDVIAKRILADISRPYFKRGLYADGILAASVAIIQKADPEFTMDGYAPPASSQDDPEQLPAWAQLLIILILILFVIFSRFIGFFGGFGGFGGGGFGGSSGGGGWSGGGGGFSGGGSSDSW